MSTHSVGPIRFGLRLSVKPAAGRNDPSGSSMTIRPVTRVNETTTSTSISRVPSSKDSAAPHTGLVGPLALQPAYKSYVPGAMGRIGMDCCSPSTQLIAVLLKDDGCDPPLFQDTLTQPLLMPASPVASTSRMRTTGAGTGKKRKSARRTFSPDFRLIRVALSNSGVSG